jgi:hypothetical protein
MGDETLSIVRAEFALLPDERKTAFLAQHPELGGADTIDLLLAVAQGSADEAALTSSGWTEAWGHSDRDHDYIHITHHCTDERLTFPKRLPASVHDVCPPPRCYCNVDRILRNASAALFLSVSLGESLKAQLSRELLRRAGLVCRSPVEGVHSGLPPPTFASLGEGRYRLTIGLENWGEDGYRLLRAYDLQADEKPANFSDRFAICPQPAGSPRSDLSQILLIKPYRTLSTIGRLFSAAQAKTAHGAQVSAVPELGWETQWPRNMRCFALSTDGQILALGMETQDGEAIVRLVQVPLPGRDDTAKEMARLQLRRGTLHGLLLINNRHLVIQTANGLSTWQITRRETLQIAPLWELADDRLESAKITICAGEIQAYRRHDNQLTSLAVDMATGEVLRTANQPLLSPGHVSQHYSHTLYDSEARLAVDFDSEGDIVRGVIWNTSTGSELFRWRLPFTLVPGNLEFDSLDNGRAVFGPGLRHLAVGTRWGHIAILDLRTGSDCVFHGHSGPICHLAFSSDGSFLASDSYDRTIAIWSVPG